MLLIVGNAFSVRKTVNKCKKWIIALDVRVFLFGCRFFFSNIWTQSQQHFRTILSQLRHMFSSSATGSQNIRKQLMRLHQHFLFYRTFTTSRPRECCYYWDRVCRYRLARTSNKHDWHTQKKPYITFFDKRLRCGQ